MEKQYIGARYVPKFYEGTNGIEWDTNKTYEALTIVTYLGDSYTSKKPVPANIGNPKDNNEYWALTGNYNGYIGEVKEEIKEIKTNIVNLGKVVQYANDKNIRIIGDSYGTTNGGEVTVVPYTVPLKDFLNKNENNYKTAHENGAGFGNDRFLALLNSFEDDISVNEVYVFGGWNDLESRYTESDVHDKMEIFTKRCREKFPNATIYLGVLGYAYEMAQEDVIKFNTLAYRTYGQCVRHGFDGLLNTKAICVQQNSDFWADTNTALGKTHPSTTGELYIAIRLASVIKTKSNSMMMSTYCVSVLNDKFENLNGGDKAIDIMQISTEESINTMFRKEIYIKYKVAGELPSLYGGSPMIIGNLTDCLNCSLYTPINVLCAGRYKVSSVFHDCNLLLILNAKQISVCILGEKIDNVEELYIYPNKDYIVTPIFG